jgi:response regulator RpfG family c-di-GMP phosphodiesterase
MPLLRRRCGEHGSATWPGWDQARLAEELRRRAGTQFDPALVQAALAHLPELQRFRKE